MQLQPNSTLQGGRYKILKTLGQGGFGITYLAVQSGLEREVAIKEFFVKDLCDREESTSHVTLGTAGVRETVNRYRDKFLKEARNISRLNHPNIVKIIDVFEENGTAYYVMEYAEKGSLAEMVKAKGLLSESVATRYILRVADALQYIHERKMNHLDVKPSNILLNEKDEPVLIDFGLSKQYDATTGSQTSTTPVGVSEGYAPMEQYKQGGVGTFTPETDIYSLGATYFKLLTGQTPPSASDVSEDGIPEGELQSRGVSQQVIDVISKAMQSRKKDRYKSVEEMVEALTAKKGSPARRDADDEATRLLGTAAPNAGRRIPTSNQAEESHEPTLEEEAEAGDAEAQFELAQEFLGEGNIEEAVIWYTKAAGQGHAEAQFELAQVFLSEENIEEAVIWYTKAAGQGHADAQYVLGQCYEFGCGVKKSDATAMLWYRKAAEQGHDEAQECLDAQRARSVNTKSDDFWLFLKKFVGG